MLTLSHFRLCPRSRAVRIALSELGLTVRLVEENPWMPTRKLLDINPSATLPVLHLADGSWLVGMYAISEFLDEGRGDRTLWSRMIGLDQAGTAMVASVRFVPGGDAEERAEVRRMIAHFSESFDRYVTQELLQEKVRPVYERRNIGPANTDVLRAIRANLGYQLGYIGLLSDQRSWLAGETMSFADLLAAAHISIADYLGEINWEAYPAVRDWYQRVKSRKSVRALLHDRIAGLTPPKHYYDLDF